jgi:hypothetical protein
MFLFGLFITIGFSPGSLIFDTAIDVLSPYITFAALLVLIVLLYVIYDSVYSPLSHLFKGYRTGGVLGIVALVLALVAGLNIFVHYSGVVMLILSMITWKLAVR